MPSAWRRARSRLVGAVGPAAVAALFRSLGASYRYAVVHPERLEALLAEGRPVVLALWHGQAFTAAGFVIGRLHRGGLPLTVIASHSRDGELVAVLARRLGVPVVRGSTSRGGRGAMLGLYRSLRDGSSAVILPDGPRGPRHVAQAGAILVSQYAQAPIVPLALAPARGWELRSWDRMSIPRPWARVAVAIGEPRQVPRRLEPAQLEDERARLQASLEALTHQARGALGMESRRRSGGRAAERVHEKKRPV
jgi:lysophospholipid acyltransferase (LPLAT)-like uncharacterized protein